MAGDVTGPTEEGTSTVFLDGCGVLVKLLSRHIVFAFIDHC